MKIIEALKEIQELSRKADDLRTKVRQNSAHLSFENPVYPDQLKVVEGWIQSHHDVLKRIELLRLCIQKTNLETDVTIELDGKNVTKSIAAWIHRRRDLAQNERAMWGSLTDRDLKEGQTKASTGEIMEVKIIRYYDPRHRDNMLELFTSEPTVIDSRLEIVNAVTDLIEL